MKYFSVLIFALMFVSCSDPASVDADREKIVIDDPSKHPPKYEITPGKIDFGEIKLNTQNEFEFNIKNLTDAQLTFSNLRLKNYQSISQFNNSVPIVLQANGNNQDNIDLILKIQPNFYGYFRDTLLIDNYKTPFTDVVAEIPALFADDVIFADTKISEFELEILNFSNISNKKAYITEFTLNDPNNVFINEPSVNLPLEINPNSESTDIKLTFNPKSIINYTAEIRIKATFEGAEYPYRQIIKVRGIGIQ